MKAQSLNRRALKNDRRAATNLCDGCCDPAIRRFVKVYYCCDPTIYRYVDVTDVNTAGEPVWINGGSPFVFRIIPTECWSSIPGEVKTFEELVAAGQAQNIEVQPQGGWDAVPGDCSSKSCPGCRCCSQSNIAPCGALGPGAGRCCSCGSVFELTFRGVASFIQTAKFGNIGIVGSGGVNPCTGQVGDFCYDPVSALVTTEEASHRITLRMRYECDQFGFWTVTCLESSLQTSQESNNYQGWPGGPSADGYWLECPPQDGYVPRFMGQTSSSCADQNCTENNCGVRPFVDQHTACSLDSVAAWALLFNFGGPAFNVGAPAGWAEIMASQCDGELEEAYDDTPRLCGGTLPGGHLRWSWSRNVTCGRGTIRESVNQQTGLGQMIMSRFAQWEVNVIEGCEEDPCDPQPLPPATPPAPFVMKTKGGQPPKVGRRSAFGATLAPVAGPRKGCGNCMKEIGA